MIRVGSATGQIWNCSVTTTPALPFVVPVTSVRSGTASMASDSLGFVQYGLLWSVAQAPPLFSGFVG